MGSVRDSSFSSLPLSRPDPDEHRLTARLGAPPFLPAASPPSPAQGCAARRSSRDRETRMR